MPTVICRQKYNYSHIGGTHMTGTRLSDALNIAKTLVELGNTIGHGAGVSSTLIQLLYNAIDAGATMTNVEYHPAKRSLIFWDNGAGIDKATDLVNMFKVNYSGKTGNKNLTGQHGTGKCAALVLSDTGSTYKTKHASYSTGAYQFTQTIEIFEEYFENLSKGVFKIPGKEILWDENDMKKIHGTGTIVTIENIYSAHIVEIEDLIVELTKKVDRYTLKKVILNGKPFPIAPIPENSYVVEREFPEIGKVHFLAYIERNGKSSTTIGGSTPLYNDVGNFVRDCFKKEYRKQVLDVLGAHPSLSIELYMDALKPLRAHSSDKVDSKKAFDAEFDVKFLQVLKILGPELLHFIQAQIEVTGEERANELAEKLGELFPLDDNDQNKLRRKIPTMGDSASENTLRFDTTGVYMLSGELHTFTISHTDNAGEINVECDPEAGEISKVNDNTFLFTAGNVTDSFPITAKDALHERTTYVHIVPQEFLGVNKRRITVTPGSKSKLRGIQFQTEDLTFTVSPEGAGVQITSLGKDEIEFEIPEDFKESKFKIFVENARGDKAVTEVKVSSEKKPEQKVPEKSTLEAPPYPGFKVYSQATDILGTEELPNKIYILDDMSDSESSAVAQLGKSEIETPQGEKISRVYINFKNPVLKGKGIASLVQLLIPYFARIHCEYHMKPNMSPMDMLNQVRSVEYNMYVHELRKD